MSSCARTTLSFRVRDHRLDYENVADHVCLAEATNTSDPIKAMGVLREMKVSCFAFLATFPERTKDSQYVLATEQGLSSRPNHLLEECKCQFQYTVCRIAFLAQWR